MPEEITIKQIEDILKRIKELETFRENSIRFKDIKKYDLLKILKLHAGLPVFTAIPTYTGFEGEFIWVNDGTDYMLYAYINGGWRHMASTDLTDTGASTLHKHDHGGMDGLLDDDHTQYLKNIVDDITPQLGGDLDLNGKNIDFTSVANVSDCKDEDNMASDSATMIATQQSIKAYVDNPAMYVSETLLISADADASTTNATYIKKKEININCSGTLRIRFRLNGIDSSTKCWGRVYRNGSAVGTEYSTDATLDITEDISGWSAGDNVQIYIKKVGSTGGNVSCSNFRLYGHRVEFTVVLD